MALCVCRYDSMIVLCLRQHLQLVLEQKNMKFNPLLTLLLVFFGYVNATNNTTLQNSWHTFLIILLTPGSTICVGNTTWPTQTQQAEAHVLETEQAAFSRLESIHSIKQKELFGWNTTSVALLQSSNLSGGIVTKTWILKMWSTAAEKNRADGLYVVTVAWLQLDCRCAGAGLSER